ncbi:hypothetical protein PRABACTJOHN_00240 [Parabacteroides johnsonii DSM 18315]|uniref:Uncharacterized protein n=1 Tax=Parabacteroides johnsonii DSM 18315 TaxID=537006 RepID=B7B5E7_9BACT|nr:hypothetical protein PRABACTJOHN_00240 [Parabacteroides johnsonii DSM 18315]
MLIRKNIEKEKILRKRIVGLKVMRIFAKRKSYAMVFDYKI